MQKSVKMTVMMGVSALCFSFGVSESLAQSRYLPMQSKHPSAPVKVVQQPPTQVKQPVEYGGLMGFLKGNKSKPQQYPARSMPHARYDYPQNRQPYKMHPGQRPVATAPAIFQQWVEYEPDYLIQPDDQLDIVVSSAPELSRTLTVGPDGRIVMPMSSPIMAAGRSFVQVQALLKAELSKQLRDPTVAVTPRAYAPQQVFVGGEVGQPGTYTIPGRIGALEAIFMAGGMRPTARTTQVAVLRRAPNGGMMMRTVDIRGGLRNIRQYSDNMQLKRGDIIYVPQSTLAEVGTFMQNFRSALPVDFNLSYQFGANNGGTTVVSP
jgi:polysaccharide export outer membrane protein